MVNSKYTEGPIQQLEDLLSLGNCQRKKSFHKRNRRKRRHQNGIITRVLGQLILTMSLNFAIKVSFFLMFP